MSPTMSLVTPPVGMYLKIVARCSRRSPGGSSAAPRGLDPRCRCLTSTKLAKPLTCGFRESSQVRALIVEGSFSRTK